MLFSLLKKPVLCAFLGLLLTAAAFPSWEKSVDTPGANPWNALLIHPGAETKILAASQNAIYETDPQSKSAWKKWTALPASGVEIKKLKYFPESPDKLFVLSEKHLYEASLSGAKPRLVYDVPQLGQTLNDFALNPARPRQWFLATRTGVLESQDAGKSWHPLLSAGKKAACFVRFSKKGFWLAHASDLSLSKDLSLFKKVFSLKNNSEEAEPSETPDSEEDSTAEVCRLFELTGNTDQTLTWLATDQGVFEKDSESSLWKSLQSKNAPRSEIHHLAYAEKAGSLYAAGGAELFEYAPKKSEWKKILLPPAQAAIRGISAAGDRLNILTFSKLLTYIFLPEPAGPSEISTGNLADSQKHLFQKLLSLEPSAFEIQQAVVRDANTKNSKITRWQAESRLRALLPSVSFKKDFSDSSNIDLDRRSTTESDVFIEGPSDTSRGWDFGVSWDLGDFIFSSSQTSIDSREKLMVELRHDLTAEAIRLYYERRRAQVETVFQISESEQEHFESLLQIEELTALLDGMTNGWMGKHLTLLYREHPELESLWVYREPLQTQKKE